MEPCSSFVEHHEFLDVFFAEPGEEERVVAKSKPMMRLVSETADAARGRSKHTVRIQTVRLQGEPLREV